MLRRVPQGPPTTKDPSDQRLPTHVEDDKYHRTRAPSLFLYASLCIVLVLCCVVRYSMAAAGTSTEATTLSSGGETERFDATEWPVLHMVHTRFMQEQSQLHALAWARLALFEAFCLPTMAQQSSRRFIWIIQTDPKLDTEILSRLKALLSPYPNFYLVLSNKNFRINRQFPGAWRGGAEAEDLRRSPVLTGNMALLHQAMDLSEVKHVLETRLDADDGLHVNLIEHIQERALFRFQQPTIRWTYWCTRRHLEWHWMDDPQHEFGVLTGVAHDKLCITPGITVGFPVGTQEADVPIFAHDKIVVTLRDMPPEQGCGATKALDCLDFIETHSFEAIRSRTPTSAGMLHVDLTPKQLKANTPFLSFMYWDTVHNLFQLNRPQIRLVNRYLTDHLIDIAKDNLYGQCTTGHSCKDKARAALEELIASRQNITSHDVSTSDGTESSAE